MDNDSLNRILEAASKAASSGSYNKNHNSEIDIYSIIYIFGAMILFSLKILKTSAEIYKDVYISDRIIIDNISDLKIKIT